MFEIFAILISLGPYIVAAIVLAFLLAGFSPWVWNHPERWLFWAILILSFSPVTGDPSGEGSLVRQISWGLMFVAVAALLTFANRRNQALVPLSKMVPPGMALLALLICFSVIWSPERFISFKRAVQCMGVFLIALMAARHAINGRTLLTQLRTPALFILLAGLSIALISPATAFDTDHALRAMSPHKNVWGQFSLIACLALLFSSLSSKRVPWIFAGGLMLAIVSLILSRSTTSILSFFFISTVVVVWMMIFRFGSLGQIALVGLVAFIAVSAHAYFVFSGISPIDAMYDLVFRVTGKDQSLTGRTYLWQLMFTEITKHLWLGTGYGGFWTNTPGDASVLVSKLNWGPPVQAHSGYIDIVNELGIIGMLVFTGCLLAHLRNIGILIKATRSYEAAFHGALVFSVLFINYAESSLLRTTHILWITVCVSIFEVHALTHDMRHSRIEKKPRPIKLSVVGT